MKNAVVFILFILCQFALKAQTQTVKIIVEEINPKPFSNYIYYNKNTLLTWNDFKAKPDENSPYQALTHAGMQLDFSSKENNKEYLAHIKIYCFFDQSKSWHKTLVNDTMLLHELFHFKITAYCYYLMKQELETLNTSKEKITETAYSIFKKYEQKSRDMQVQYDKETDHSVNYEKQIAWQQKMQQLLQPFEN